MTVIIMHQISPTEIQEFLVGAREGDKQDPSVFVRYCRRFNSVILWGAGNLGNALGLKFKELGIPISNYWDTNHDSIKECHDVEVVAPFSSGKSSDSLVIFCIGNVAVGPNVFRQLEKNGWQNVIHGNDLLQGLLCPLDNKQPPKAEVCNSFDICSVCSCQRLHNIVNADVARKQGIKKNETLSFDRIHFITNNICNLKCTHCFMYINSYPKALKKNVSTKQVLQDIQLSMTAIHSLGVVNIFGGEPFLHKDLHQIVSGVLGYQNFGSVIVNTNGLIKMKPHQLEPLKDKRVRLAFSNYLEVTDEKAQKLFFDNIEKARASGVNTKYQNSLPTWNISSTLEDKNDDEQVMINKKEACGVKFLYVFDGKIFPCAFSLSLYDLEVADYNTDYVELDPDKTPEQLRKEIIEMVSRPFYHSCSHCETFGSPALTNVAAEQGYDERYALPKKTRKLIDIPIVSELSVSEG